MNQTLPSEAINLIQNSDPFLDLIVQLIATLIGALLGLTLAMAYDRKKKKDDMDEARKLTITAIKDEVNEIKDKLDNPQRKGDWVKAPSYKFEITNLPVGAYESAINSGNFSLLPSETQLDTSKLYLDIQYCNSLVKQITEFYGTQIFGFNRPEGDIIATSLYNELRIKYYQLSTSIDNMLKKLPSENFGNQ